MKPLILAILVISGTVTDSNGTEPRGVRAIFGGGGAIPVSDVNMSWNEGYFASGGLVFEISPVVDLATRVEYHHMFWDHFGSSKLGGNALTELLFGADLIAAPKHRNGKLVPLLMGGFGIGRAGISDLRQSGTIIRGGSSETKIYFDFGAGFTLTNNRKMTWLLSIRYVKIPTSGSPVTFIPIGLSVLFK